MGRWDAKEFAICLVDENVFTDTESPDVFIGPLEDGSYEIMANFGWLNFATGARKFFETILSGEIPYPDVTGSYEKFNEELGGYEEVEYTNEEEWKKFIAGELADTENLSEATETWAVPFYLWTDGRFKIGNSILVEIRADDSYYWYNMPADFMQALLVAWIEEAGSERALVNFLKKGLPKSVRDELDDEDEVDEEEEPVDMMSFIGQAISPSRYRGLTDRSRYELLNDRFAYIVDGVLICTDRERDIDCDGNICMVWPDGKVLHIGQIWMPESPEINKVKFSRSGNTLKQSCRVWYDNDHHHGGIEEEEIDLTPTDERRRRVEMNYLAADFVETFRGVDRGSFYVESVKAYFQKKKGGKEYLILESNWVKRVPRAFKKHNHWEEIYINLTDGQFEDEHGEEITGGRFFKKLRCKLEEDSGKDPRVVFCERFIPTLQKFYPNVKAPLQEGLHPLYMRAMVIKDFLELTATDMVPSKSNVLSNYFRDYAWINHYDVRYIKQYTMIAFDFTDDKIAEIYKHIK